MRFWSFSYQCDQCRAVCRAVTDRIDRFLYRDGHHTAYHQLKILSDVLCAFAEDWSGSAAVPPFFSLLTVWPMRSSASQFARVENWVRFILTGLYLSLYSDGYSVHFLESWSGNILPARVVSALSVALYGMFLAIIIPPARNNRVLAGVVVISMAASFLIWQNTRA